MATGNIEFNSPPASAPNDVVLNILVRGNGPSSSFAISQDFFSDPLERVVDGAEPFDGLIFFDIPNLIIASGLLISFSSVAGQDSICYGGSVGVVTAFGDFNPVQDLGDVVVAPEPALLWIFVSAAGLTLWIRYKSKV